MKKIIFCFFTILCIILSCSVKSNADTKNYKKYCNENKSIDELLYYKEVKMHGGHEYYLYYEWPGSSRPFAVEHKIDCKKCSDLFN